MTYTKGKLEDYAAKRKGYISGSFFEKSLLNYDERVEINFSKLPDDFSVPKHLHKHMKTWVIVTKGRMYFKIDDQAVDVGEDEFLIFESNTPEEVVKVDPGTECINIHVPSVAGGDKVVL